MTNGLENADGLTKNSKELMRMAEELRNKWGYDYATFCEEVSKWGEENDRFHDGYSPTDDEIGYARKRFTEIRQSKCSHKYTVLEGSEPHFEPRKYFSVPVECPDCLKQGNEIYVVDRIEGLDDGNERDE